MSDERYSKERAERVMRMLADKGRALEAGWLVYRMHLMSPKCPPDQVREVRIAWHCGASFIFSLIMNMLEPGEDATAGDMSRMTAISKELQRFETELRHLEQHDPAMRAAARTCSRCGRTSYNNNDIQEGYCGACHDWT